MMADRESDYTGASHSGDTWRQVQRTIRMASTIRTQSDDLVNQILNSGKDERWKRALQREGSLQIFCGNISVDSKVEVELFWDCVRAVVYDQFGGFLVDQTSYVTKIVHKTKEMDEFWNTGDEVAGDVGDEVAGDKAEQQQRYLGARRYILASIYGAINRLIPIKEPEVKSYLKDMKEKISEGLLKGLKSKKLIFPDSLRTRPGTAHRNELAILLHKLKLSEEPEGSEEEPLDSEEGLFARLFARLERLLTRGSERATAFEVSILLRMLGGRYLNKTPKDDLGRSETFRESISYVLAKQDKRDGRWSATAKPRNPLVHDYSPLAYLLDLGTDVLGPHLEDLSSAAERAMTSLKYDLDECANDLSPEKDGVVSKIIVGLTVGAIASDRFKDLLSKSILDKLGAIDPQTEVEWKDISNALGFKENMESGVIKKWQERSSRRPGALLVYGPPGTGKTTIAKVLAKELNKKRLDRSPDVAWRFLELSPADFAREGSDKIVARAEQLFGELKQVRRCVVLLDEMEEFLRIRDQRSDKESRLITTAFLPLLQEAVDSREIILVVATNFVGNIDPAVTRRGRFDLILPLGPPNAESRAAIIGGPESSVVGEVASSAVGRGTSSIVGGSTSSIVGRSASSVVGGAKSTNVEGLASSRVGGLESYREILELFPGKSKIDRAFLLEMLIHYTMGYTRSEIEDFLLEFRRKCKEDGDRTLMSRAKLVVELWRIRSERVPTALSGRAGCNWRAFADEAQRFARYAIYRDFGGDTYWREPELPHEEDRNPES